MKKTTLSFFCFCFPIISFCQKVKAEDFASVKFGKTQYELINYAKYNISSVVCLAFSDSSAYKKSKNEIVDCKSLAKNNVQFYLIVWQGKEIEQQELFVEFVRHIDSRRKIMDSRLFIISQTAFLQSQQIAKLEKIHRIENQFSLADFSGCDTMKEKIAIVHH